MTLVEVRNQIIGKMIDKETIKISELSILINVDEEFKDIKESLIKAATKELVDVSLVTIIDDNLLILNQPINSQGQDIQISMKTANDVADFINSYLDAHEFKEARADKLNITETDVVMLLAIIQDFITDDDENEETFT